MRSVSVFHVKFFLGKHGKVARDLPLTCATNVELTLPLLFFTSSLSLPLSLFLSLSQTNCLAHKHNPVLSHTLFLSVTPQTNTRTHLHTNARSFSNGISYTLSHSLSFTLAHTLTLIFSRKDTHAYYHSHSHTHSHFLSLVGAPSLLPISETIFFPSAHKDE